MEDEVVTEFAYNQLEQSKSPDGREIQINLTGFLNAKNAKEFMGELWELLLTAQTAPDGIPPKLIELKKQELLSKKEEEQRLLEKSRLEELSLHSERKENNEELRRSKRHYEHRSYSRSPEKERKRQDRSNSVEDKTNSNLRGRRRSACPARGACRGSPSRRPGTAGL